jgi:hypothetical protein
MLCLRYSQFLFEIARGNGHETEFANGVEGAVRVVAVRENRYVAEHLVSSLYAQDRNFGTSPQPPPALLPNFWDLFARPYISSAPACLFIFSLHPHALYLLKRTLPN